MNPNSEPLETNEQVIALDRRALQAAERFKASEAELLSILQDLDALKGFRQFGCISLLDYALKRLGLSLAVSLNLINVARKSVEVPELKTEIERGGLSVCVARKLVPVLTPENQEGWIAMAKRLPVRQLEKEIARVRPEEATPERVRYVSESRASVSLGLDETALQAVRRVQDLESQRLRRHVTMEEAISAMSAAYLEKHDPLEKAKRAVRRLEAKSKAATDPEAKAVARAEAEAVTVGHSAALEPSGQSVLSGGSDGTVVAPLSEAELESIVENKIRSVLAYVHSRASNSHVTWHVPVRRGAHSASSGDVRSASRRSALIAASSHAVRLRDQGRCTHVDDNGVRCEHRRWLHVHHVVPVSHGGSDEVENLTMLCSGHHQLEHAALQVRG